MANLNSTADINSYIGLVNAAGAGVVNPEVFYSKQLLDTIRLDAAAYTYYRYADEMPIQEKADKLTIRRWAPLRAHTVPLTEGVPPKSDKGSVEKYEMQAYQYGRYMEFTDKVDFKVVDPVVAHYTQEYSIVAIETLDLLAQETLLTVAQKHYAGLATSVSALMKTSFDGTAGKGVPTIADLRIIGLSLKKQLVKPRSNGKYHVLCSPEFVYDMLDDPFVKNYMTLNQTTNPMYDNNALTPMFGFEFYEVMNCPTDNEYTVGTDTYKAYKVGKTYADATELSRSTASGIAANNINFISTSASATIFGIKATAFTKADGYEMDSRTGSAASFIPEMESITFADGFVAEPFNVQHTIILGAEALAKTGLAGEQNAKMYVKPLGSSGVLDPLEQRQSIGFKINSVGFASTRLEAVVDYINIPTQLNV